LIVRKQGSYRNFCHAILDGCYSFCRKEIHIPLPDNGFYYYWQHVAQGDSGWHGLEAVVILLFLKNRKLARAKIRA
jgi:hypothetical protein